MRLDGIEVHRTGGRYTFSMAAPWYYLRNLRRDGWDVVVDNLNKVPLFSPWWTSAPVVPLVHHLFGLTAFREASFPLASATWLMERPLPLVYRGRPTIAVSRSTRDDLTRRGLRAPMEVIPVGVDTRALRAAPGGPQDARAFSALPGTPQALQKRRPAGARGGGARAAGAARRLEGGRRGRRPAGAGEAGGGAGRGGSGHLPRIRGRPDEDRPHAHIVGARAHVTQGGLGDHRA